MYLQPTSVNFSFSMDLVGHDRMTLGGLLAPQSIKMNKLVDVLSLIQSGHNVVLNSVN